jgi:hypothetical protein
MRPLIAVSGEPSTHQISVLLSYKERCPLINVFDNVVGGVCGCVEVCRVWLRRHMRTGKPVHSGEYASEAAIKRA